MKKILFTISIFVFAGLIAFKPVNVEAQELRIGVVDADLILAQLPELTTINDQLEGFVSRKRREFAQLETEFLRAREEFEQKVAVISESARQGEQERLAQMARNLQQFQMDYQNELLARQESLINPLRERILNAINEVSRELNLAYVLNRMVNNGDMVVLYMSDDMKNRYDITARVQQKLGVTPR